MLFSQDGRGFFWTGFGVGICWFYWISFSFIHYGFAYLLPIGILGIACIYGFLFFAATLLHHNPWIKALSLVLLTQLHPFGFNWLDLRLLLVQTPFAVDYIALCTFIIASLCFLTCKGRTKLFVLPFLLLSLDGTRDSTAELPFEIALTQTSIHQSEKWLPHLRNNHIKNNIQYIQEAAAQKKRLIVLPESAFPLYLNQSPVIMSLLKELSYDIAIITGALTLEDKKFYNSTYLFDKGNVTILHKVILVPFGEEVPLPKFMKHWINAIFYGGAEDFSVASSPQDFIIDHLLIRNAICFEATRPELFANNPTFMIATSNNAWFTPSSEPILQKQLLILQASLHHTTIYHSVNGSKSEIIKEKQSGPLGPLRELFFKTIEQF